MNNSSVLESLYDPQTIRAQAHSLLKLARAEQLKHFIIDEEQLLPTASFIIDVIMRQYPTLDIPYHSRWRHFEAGGLDRISLMQADLGNLSAMQQGAILYELVILSVFLDAGAGASWQYIDNQGQKYARSEGLALASLEMYQKGAFSAHKDNPYRVDAQKLLDFTEKDLILGFQVTETNPLEGISGRVNLLNQLGALLQKKPDFFGSEGRLGHFYSYVSALATNKMLPAANLFQAVLQAFNGIWPKRISYEGVFLGDVWIHQALKTDKPGSEYIPFHKLSQWLTYSLIEPLEKAGIQVVDLEALTGLPEYRNGGLLIDTGLLKLKNSADSQKAHEPGSELIIEWRGLTVGLLDELAVLIRKQLNQDKNTLPLAKILQGGTWEAGRQIAKQKRAQGTPPLQIISDGTVF